MSKEIADAEREADELQAQHRAKVAAREQEEREAEHAREQEEHEAEQEAEAQEKKMQQLHEEVQKRWPMADGQCQKPIAKGGAAENDVHSEETQPASPSVLLESRPLAQPDLLESPPPAQPDPPSCPPSPATPSSLADAQDGKLAAGGRLDPADLERELGNLVKSIPSLIQTYGQTLANKYVHWQLKKLGKNVNEQCCAELALWIGPVFEAAVKEFTNAVAAGTASVADGTGTAAVDQAESSKPSANAGVHDGNEKDKARQAYEDWKTLMARLSAQFGAHLQGMPDGGGIDTAMPTEELSHQIESMPAGAERCVRSNALLRSAHERVLPACAAGPRTAKGSVEAPADAHGDHSQARTTTANTCITYMVDMVVSASARALHAVNPCMQAQLKDMHGMQIACNDCH